ncbi:MAG: hypothetical protein Tsb0016_11560 [Sphingomonadales bacterium]
MRFWRGCGWLFLVLGIGVLGMDMLHSLEEGRLHIFSLAEHWASLAPESFRAFWGDDAAAQGWGHRLVAAVTRLPGFAPFLLLGLILIVTHPYRRRGIFRR